MNGNCRILNMANICQHNNHRTSNGWHFIFIGPLFLGFHRHDVINKYVVRKRKSTSMCSMKKIIFFCGGNIKNMRALNRLCCVKERVATFEVTREVKHDVYGKRQTAKIKLLPSVFSSLYSRIKIFVYAVNSMRHFSIFV